MKSSPLNTSPPPLMLHAHYKRDLVCWGGDVRAGGVDEYGGMQITHVDNCCDAGL